MKLTIAQQEAIDYLILGMSYVEIGQWLNISPRAAQSRIMSVMRKYNVRTKEKLLVELLKKKHS